MNYKLENLPPVWCVGDWRNHKRSNDFRELFRKEFKTNVGFYDFYGYNSNEEVYKRLISFCSGSKFEKDFKGEVLDLDTFFALIGPLRLEEGNWLYYHRDDLAFTGFERGVLYKIHSITSGGSVNIINSQGIQYFGARNLERWFRNATPEEIKAIEKPVIADVRFQKNETVLVRDSEDEAWQERLFVIEHEGLYYCAVETHAGLEPFRFIKPFEKPDLLRSKLDAIIKEYAKAGIKLTPTFEKM